LPPHAGQAMAARALIRAGLLLGDRRFEDMGRGVLRAHHQLLQNYGIAAPSLLIAVELALSDPREVVIVGEPGDPAVVEFLSKARSFPQHRVVTLLHSGNRERLLELVPMLKGKDMLDGRPAVYVCRHGVCERPVTDPGELRLTQAAGSSK